MLFTELEFDAFAFRNLMSTLVSEVAAEVVNDCANHVEPDAVLHAPSFIWVKRLVVPASTRSPGALSPAKVARVIAAITRTAASGLTRIPCSLIFRAFMRNSLVSRILTNPRPHRLQNIWFLLSLCTAESAGGVAARFQNRLVSVGISVDLPRWTEQSRDPFGAASSEWPNLCHYLSQRFAHFVMSDVGNPSGSVSATSASFDTMLTIRHLPVESTAKNVSEADSSTLVARTLAIP